MNITTEWQPRPRARRLAWETVRANEKNEQLVASLEGALEAEVRPEPEIHRVDPESGSTLRIL
jgi:hypothetical protein